LKQVPNCSFWEKDPLGQRVRHTQLEEMKSARRGRAGRSHEIVVEGDIDKKEKGC